MRTHVELNDAVLDQVMQLGRFASKKEAVNTALAEMANTLKRRELLALRGKIVWQADLQALRGPRGGGAAAKKSTA